MSLKGEMTQRRTKTKRQPLAGEPYDKVQSNFRAVSAQLGEHAKKPAAADDVRCSPLCGPGHWALLLDKVTKAGEGALQAMPRGLMTKVWLQLKETRNSEMSYHPYMAL